ncbi:MAG TPA: hypothetical protein VEQ42_02880, partial [Pyrinomonadaceae bacterium]|nr:hypothetical protein [Pyrinomonadaceae bacterium]
DTGTAQAPSPAIVWWRPVGDIFRFPLAGFGARAGELFFPVGMPAVPEHYLGPVRLPGTELERDGLARFDASLFLDDGMLDTGTEDLISTADFLRYLAPKPRALRGIHAALAVEEATVVAAPDAVQPGWFAVERSAPRPPVASLPLERPAWWRFLDCRGPRKFERVTTPPWGNFLRCDTRVVPAPELSTSDAFTRSGTFTLSWTDIEISSPPTDAKKTKYVLEEAAEPDFSDAAIVFSGARARFTIYGRRPGDYYYRVRAVVCCDTSDWSAGVVVRVAASDSWQVRDEDDYKADALLAVQRALLRMCAARGDLFAVMSLPEHFREDATVEHVARLKLTPERDAPAEGVSALGYGEAHAFSYGALYHPWLVGREENRFDEIRATPPCGAACGVIARRSIARGAWVAPANEPVRDVVTLAPPVSPERRLALQEAQVNLVRQEPRGFLSLSADTLSDDPDYRPINVRRLLMLLRRLALKLGATYVFEPNSPSFRRLVERGFTAMLDQMFVRGAFAGKTAQDSYEVNVDSSLNTPQSVEQGRFIVELRVAPSLPMTFLTIRLVQTGERGLVTEAS